MEIEDKDDLAIVMQDRIKAPLSWNSPPFAEIIDLKEDHHDEVIRLIKHHFVTQDPMCRASFIYNDEDSVNEYLNLIRVWMKDSTSIVALSSRSGRVIGAAITRINSNLDRTNTYSRVQIVQGKALEKIMHLKSKLVRQAEAYKYFEDDSTFRVYVLCCHPSYQKRNLENILLETCIDVASTLNIPAVVGIFTSGFTQKLATEVGFKPLTEILYSRWIVDDKIVFRDPGVGNYSVAFMGMNVPKNEELEIRQQVKKLQYDEMIIDKYCRPVE